MPKEKLKSRRSRLRLPLPAYLALAGVLTAASVGAEKPKGASTAAPAAAAVRGSETVSGTVTDGSGHGWGLYAKIQAVSTDPVSIEVAYTNPENGEYQLDLDAGVTYQVTVTSLYPGYTAQTRSVASDSGTQDFALETDATCSAPGFGLVTAGNPLVEDFTAEVLPTDWTVEGTAPPAAWAFDDPDDRGNYTGGTDGFAIADSDYAGLVQMDTELITPTLDFSGSDGVQVRFKTDFYTYNYSADTTMEVDISTDDGATWTNSWFRDGLGGPFTEEITTSLSFSEELSTVKVRFHHVALFDFWWQIDDVEVDGVNCDPVAGSLIIGNVKDANSSARLNGATVTGSADATNSFSAPPANEGFYFLFEETGSPTLTASLGGYSDDSVTITVGSDEILLQDFNLGSTLSHTPAPVTATVQLGNTASVPTTLENDDPNAIAFTVYERGSSRTIEAADRGRTTILYESKEAVAVSGARNGATKAYPKGYRWQPTQPSLAGPALRVLVYSDDFVHQSPDTFPEVALRTIGADFNHHTGGAPGYAAFEADLAAGGWDVVVFSGENFSPPTSTLAAMNSYVQNGGRLLFTFWNISAAATNPLYATLGFTFVSNDDSTPDPIFWWDDDHVDFNYPEVAPEWTTLTAATPPYGQKGNTTGDGVAIAGWTNPGPDANQVAMVVANSGRSVFKGFTDVQNDADLDTDSVDDGVELWINLIQNSPFNHGADVPWYDPQVTSGTVAGNGSTAIGVAFDASVAEVDQPGLYRGALTILGANGAAVQVPVEMTVTAPPTWGKVEGVVATLGYCDEGPPVLAPGAEITFGSANLVTEDGLFSIWGPSGVVNLTASFPGYADQTVPVTVVAGQTVTASVNLRLDVPCTSRDLQTVEAEVAEGATETVILTLNNNGGGELTFDVLESDQALPASGLAAKPVRKPLKAHARSFRKSEKLVGSSKPMGSAPTQQSLQGLPDFALEGWFSGAPIPGGNFRYAAAQCLEYPTKFYTFKGQGLDFADFNLSWEYDASTNVWTELAPVPSSGGNSAAAACFEGKIYVMGGTDSPTSLFIYDVASDSWTQGADLPRAVNGGEAGAWDGKIVLIGGDADGFTAGAAASTQIDIYDIAGDSWSTSGATTTTGAALAGSVQVNEYVYVAGGFSGLNTTNVAATGRYDIANDVWEAGPALGLAQADVALAATDVALYLIGGDATGGGQFNSLDVVQRLEYGAWPAGTWTEDEEATLPFVQSSNDAGFCTPQFGSSAIWSLAGGDPASNYDVNLFRIIEGEKCVSLFNDVPWLAADPTSGAVPSDDTLEVEVEFDATSLTSGEYTATLVFTTNDPGKPLFNVPVVLTVVAPTYGSDLVPDPGNRTVAAGTTAVYTVTIENTGNATDSFNLSVTGNNWPTNLSSTSVGPLAPGETADVTVTVFVPANAGGNVVDNATIRATSVGNSATFDTTVVATTAQRSVSVAVGPSASEQASSGSTATYTVDVRNTGNASDNFNLTVSGGTFAASVSPTTTGPLAPGASRAVVVTVTVPANATGGASNATILTARSQANSSVTNTATLTTTVRAVYGSMVTPTNSVQIGNAGTTVSFDVTVRNVGNLTDTFNITLSGATWTTVLAAGDDVVGPLQPNATEDITITVTIPAGSSTGDDSSVVVTATSQSNPGLVGSSALITRATTTVDAQGLGGLLAMVLMLVLVAGATITQRKKASQL